VRFSDVVELPLVILAVAMIPLIIIPLVADLPSDVGNAFETADFLIWGIFVLEYAVKISLAPNRVHYFTHSLLDLVVVACRSFARCGSCVRLGRCDSLDSHGWARSPDAALKGRSAHSMFAVSVTSSS
jgi:hypothetical protein